MLGLRGRPKLTLILVGLIFFVGGTVWIANVDHDDWLSAHGVRTTARWADVNCSGRACGNGGDVKFETPDGVIHTAHIALSDYGSHKFGGPIRIAYNPNQPSEARSLQGDSSPPMAVGLGAIAYFIAGLCWFFAANSAWKAWRRRHGHGRVTREMALARARSGTEPG